MEFLGCFVITFMIVYIVAMFLALTVNVGIRLYNNRISPWLDDKIGPF